MKKFIVTEERLVTAIWTYEVDAETEAEALEQVQNGNITPNEMRRDWEEHRWRKRATGLYLTLRD